MVISSKPALLKTAATWITRLDRSDTAATGVKVYQVRYGDARLLAQLLNDIFGAGGGSRGLVDSATNQIAPGSGVATSTTTMGQQSGLQLPGARNAPGGSSTDSRLSGTANPIVGIGGQGGTGAGGFGSGGSSPNDVVASRSGSFGRQAP